MKSIAIVSSIAILLLDTYRGRNFRYRPALHSILRWHEARLAEIPPPHKRVYCYVGGIFTGHIIGLLLDGVNSASRAYENAATAENRP